ncbi:MAG: 50S ribosomal protein L10 [Clostridiales bacterium]|nr:50S ribosomal protein L10 [Clostridiales bacterium]
MPSQKILEKKQAAVSELSEKLRSAVSGVLVKYEGITVEDDTKMRAALRKAGVEYAVVKNTLTKRACDEVGLSEMSQYLKGMTALAISKDDPVAPAKILKEYSEKVPTFEIKSGFLDGAVIDVTSVMNLASIPSKETLIAKMMGSLQSSLYGLCYVLQAKIDKESAAEEATAEA